MKIYAGIVLFNPDIELLSRNIEGIINQVNEIVLIDNNSKNILEIKEKYANERKIKLICNKNNLGIASALNQVLEWGEEKQYKWALTLDQDSICDTNLIQEYSKYIALPNIGIISPLIEDRYLVALKKEEINDITEIRNCEDVITSGCLVNLNIANKIGKFNEKLFIDFVDTEFNHRLLINNYKIIRVNTTKLNHSVGEMKIYRIGFLKIKCSNHSSFRRYYMVRNRLYFRKKYFGYYSFLKEYLRLILGTIKIYIFEKEKWNKLQASIKGFKDYKELM